MHGHRVLDVPRVIVVRRAGALTGVRPAQLARVEAVSRARLVRPVPLARRDLLRDLAAEDLVRLVERLAEGGDDAVTVPVEVEVRHASPPPHGKSNSPTNSVPNTESRTSSGSGATTEIGKSVV